MNAGSVWAIAKLGNKVRYNRK